MSDISAPKSPTGSPSGNDARATADELYVGYLPVPVRQKRFLRIVVPCVLWALCIVALVWAWSQRDPGNAVWEAGRPRTFAGTLWTRPYPMLVLDRGEPGLPRTLLLVEAGKHGVSTRTAVQDGKRASVSGWLLRRGGCAMIELEPEESAVRAADGLPAAREESVSWTRVTLRGEIVDSKCSLGAMKPGEGKTHKACATLCIRGGIPPSFVAFDTRCERRTYLLTDEHGGRLSPDALQFIADPVEVTGEAGMENGLETLRVRASGIRRL